VKIGLLACRRCRGVGGETVPALGTASSQDAGIAEPRRHREETGQSPSQFENGGMEKAEAQIHLSYSAGLLLTDDECYFR
jgi:hypothetical protein